MRETVAGEKRGRTGHVEVGGTVVGEPEPTADALLARARRHRRRNVEVSLLVVNAVRLHREDGEVVHRNLRDVVDVGNTEGATGDEGEVEFVGFGVAGVVGPGVVRARIQVRSRSCRRYTVRCPSCGRERCEQGRRKRKKQETNRRDKRSQSSPILPPEAPSPLRRYGPTAQERGTQVPCAAIKNMSFQRNEGANEAK